MPGESIRPRLFAALTILLAAGASPALGGVMVVRGTAQLMSTLQRAQPGLTILLAPGVYTSPIVVENLRGAPGRPIIIGAADPKRRPIIRGGGDGLKLTDPGFVEVRDLIIDGVPGTGFHVDDGGSYETPAHDLVIRNIKVRNTGDSAMKLTGVDRFKIEGLDAAGWNSGGGCGLNLMGCHDGTVSGLSLVNPEGQAFGGIQMKAGCLNISVTGSRFVGCGMRAVQIGGSTPDGKFFRPWNTGYEAKNIKIRRNVFVGAEAALAIVQAEQVEFAFNTIYDPKNYVIRVLNEPSAAFSLPPREVAFNDNIIAFRSSQFQETVNAGGGTRPEMIRFARNWWYCIDQPGRSRPNLPSAEADGVSGRDPGFVDPEHFDLRVREDGAARDRGAYAVARNSQASR